MKKKILIFVAIALIAFGTWDVGDFYSIKTYNVLKYGAIGDSSTNCTAAFQATVNAVVASGAHIAKIEVPVGNYMILTSVHVPQGISIEWVGAGGDNGLSILAKSQLITTSATNDIILDSGYASNYSNLKFLCTATTPTASAAIRLWGGANRFRDLSITGFYDGIVCLYNQYNIYDHVFWTDCVNTDISLSNRVLADGGDASFNNCYFTSVARNTAVGIYQINSGGTKVVNCKWNASAAPGTMGDCIKIFLNTSANSTSDYFFSNNSFENYTGYAVNIETAGGGVCNNVTINGGNISSFRSGNGVRLVTAVGSTLKNISITGVSINNCTTGILATLVDHLNVAGVDNTATTPYNLTGLTNYFNDQNDLTYTSHGLAPAALAVAFLQSSAPTINATVVQDDFTGANTVDIAGRTPSPTSAGNWVNVFGAATLGITSNQLYCPTSGTIIYEVPTGGLNNMDVSVVLPTATITGSGGMGLIANFSAYTQYLYFNINSAGAYSIGTVIGGTATNIATGTLSLSNGDTLHFRTSNGTAYALKNSTLLNTAVYSNIVFVGSGAGVYYTGNTATIEDHFVISSLNNTPVGWGITTDATCTGNGTPASPLHSNGLSGLTAPRVPFALSSSTLSDDGAMTWDNTAKSLNILGSTTNSTHKIGSLEFQSYAVNNQWIGDNTYFNGTNFLRRAAGYTSMIRLEGNETQFNFGATSTAGSTVTEVIPLKTNLDGTVALGGTGINATPGSYAGASMVVNGSNVLIGLTATNSTALVQIQTSAQPQLGLHYDATHYTTLQGASAGGLVIQTTNNAGIQLNIGSSSPGTPASLDFHNIGSFISFQTGANSRVGQVALVSGTKAITITGVGSTSLVFVQLVSQGGTVSTTVGYEGVCTTNTLTLNAVTSAGSNALNTLDASTVNYWVINSFNDWMALMLTLGLIRPLFKRKSFHEMVYNQAA